MSERYAILGASRGLGAAFVRHVVKQNPAADWLLISRKAPLLERLASEIPGSREVVIADFSKREDQEKVLSHILSFGPSRLIYFAGGGPHQLYQSAGWKDHLWALEVSFIFPARVLHQSLMLQRETKQIVFIGSAIAESSPDGKAASYAAAKHALKGLVSSVRAEKPPTDLRLYSPGFMNTELLPPHAWPRQQGLVLEPSSVAVDLYEWLFQNDDTGFRIYK
jgi:short-subunit dehydrogenase